MNTLPTITVARSGQGWVATCSCGAEVWTERRPAVDKWAHEHRKTHAKERD